MYIFMYIHTYTYIYLHTYTYIYTCVRIYRWHQQCKCWWLQHESKDATRIEFTLTGTLPS